MFVLECEFIWQEKDYILDVSIDSYSNFIGFISEGHMSCIQLSKRSYPGKKTKNTEEKRLNCFRWTKDRSILVAGIIDVQPRMYCLDENLQ